MFSSKLFFLFVFFISYNICFSQEKSIEVENPMLPNSIYSENILSYKNSTFLIHNKLKLKNYKFVFLDVDIINDGYFTIPLKNIAKPSSFVFETFKDIQNKRNLELSFFDVSKLYLPYYPRK